MYFKQFYLGCLAHASYLIASEGEAVVVDPQRDVDQYIDEAEAQWFNIKSVKLQTFGTFGNLGRNTIISPGIFAWDFSTLKNFNFSERTYLQFRFECFNCANHPNFGDPGSSMALNQKDANGFAIPGTGTFGVITNTRSGIDIRKLQFSLKLVF